MYKSISIIILMLITFMAIYSCSSSGDDNTKYLARNVILNANLVNNAYADQSRAIDTETQVLLCVGLNDLNK